MDESIVVFLLIETRILFMKYSLLSLLFMFFAVSTAAPQPTTGRMTPETYIAAFKDAAIADMKKTGVPASITLAQGIYESDCGNSDLAREANNHFGIKCHKEWNGNTFHKDDDAKDECFRKYNTVQQSYDDHSDFLRTRDRYAFLFNLDITDYKGWAHGLKKAGYATNPKYAHKIIELIERYSLQNLDRGETIPVASVTKTPEYIKEKNTASTPARRKEIVIAQMGEINDIPFVRAKKNDSYVTIARDYDLKLWQVLKYNDVDKGDALNEKEIIFLKPKRNKADAEFHVVKRGETLHDISQLYGIKIKKLYSRNDLVKGEEPKPGVKIWLNKNKPH